ncbi:DUF928 domain-containing protein [Thermosynechococcus sp. HN-54]|uniref:DUF928 domain-containing protein n=1 Tax=Thermosynechococcus sp. HN-54 TaxID=2933959 RepID=UPI00202CC114|nr:DUF928 domain-containing protein [Thermosynechococcus sp. HN-54]URR36631.1 DUF928 domain-containing protein [Thermosynechococcus sp. HN-54]
MRRLVALVPTVTLCLCSVGIAHLSLAQGGAAVLAQSTSFAARLRANLPERGVPGSRFGGATRGACVTGNQRLTALVPSTNVGQTTLAAPTLFVFVPPSKARQGELVITDAQDQPLATMVVDLPAELGVMALKPKVQLQPGQDYRWTFTLLCGADADDPSAFISVSGVVSRVQPSTDLAKKLQGKSVGDRLGAAVDAGLWYETLAILAELQRDQTTREMARREWVAVLSAVGLDGLAQAPLVQ